MPPIEDYVPEPNKPLAKGTLVCSGVDYITVTQKGLDKRRELHQLGYTLFNREVMAGFAPAPFRAHGYDGVHAGRVNQGERDDSVMLQLSGDLADVHWRDALRLASNCSRLDLQVTVRFNVPQPDVHLYSYVTAAGLSKARGKPLKVSAVISNDGSGTVYLGSRKSEEFARVYNKALESGDPFWQGCWRYEVQRSDDAAFQTARSIGQDDTWRERVRGVVWDYFAQRGVVLPFDRGGGPLLAVHRHNPNDDERRLSWFASQIRPAILDILGRVDRSEVLMALGLDDLGRGTSH